jgi:hypothetical protein
MYRPARVRLEDFDPDWSLRYADEALLLTGVLDDRLLSVEHVGSTSIHGTPAKPIIDILATVPVGHPGFDGFPEGTGRDEPAAQPSSARHRGRQLLVVIVGPVAGRSWPCARPVRAGDQAGDRADETVSRTGNGGRPGR